MSDEKRTVTISFEDAQRIFDLAVGADQMCSGYMETDDVHAMRRLAVTLGVDPAVCTSAEFESQFPHRFKPNTRVNVFDQHRRRVLKKMPDTGAAWDIEVSAPETDDEVLARIGASPAALCDASYRCGKPADDPIHVV